MRLLSGPVGGGCAMTSREVYDRVGGFVQQRGKVFYQEDAAYIRRIERHGYAAAYSATYAYTTPGGEYYGELVGAKAETGESTVVRTSAAKPLSGHW